MIPIADTVADLEESEKSINFLQQHDSACQGLGTPDSLLPPSEPLNIKNWFSSYEYDSLVLETNDNFGFSDHQESQGGYREEFIRENSRDFIRGGKNDCMTEKKTTSSMSLIKCNESNKCENQCLNQVSDLPNSPVLSPEPPGIDKWFSSYAYAVDDVIVCDDKESMMECCSNGKRKEGDDELICNQSLEEVDNGSTKKESPVGSRFGNVEIKVKDEVVEANGFVSVKRKREDGRGKNNELTASTISSSSFVGSGNYGNGIVNGNGIGIGIGIGIGKNKKDERKTLADITNIEMTGKWKCPQKGKPKIGPPLKQLRLGQWFHHV